MPQRLTWCEVSLGALKANLAEFRRLVGPSCALAPVVKSNAYGHGLVLAARAFADAGADLLCVNDLWEASVLRGAGLTQPLHVLGRVEPGQAAEAITLDVSLVAYDAQVMQALDEAARGAGRMARVHLKLETGTHRQGVDLGEALLLVRHAAGMAGVTINAVSTHFADVEDTTDHTFARRQLAAFHEGLAMLRAEGLPHLKGDIANSAATILWPEAHGDMVRVGISAYGMWPSSETLVSATLAHRDRVVLQPALTWKTRVAQVKTVPAGTYVGYGRTYRTTHDTRIAVLPIGYYDGYDRGMSNTAYVLVRGMRAQVRGRVCMNMLMIDVGDVVGVEAGDEAVLIGRTGDDAVTAEQFAGWAGTINYEATTRIAESVPRVAVC
jgi:alanine racemase